MYSSNCIKAIAEIPLRIIHKNYHRKLSQNLKSDYDDLKNELFPFNPYKKILQIFFRRPNQIAYDFCVHCNAIDARLLRR